MPGLLRATNHRVSLAPHSDVCPLLCRQEIARLAMLLLLCGVAASVRFCKQLTVGPAAAQHSPIRLPFKCTCALLCKYYIYTYIYMWITCVQCATTTTTTAVIYIKWNTSFANALADGYESIRVDSCGCVYLWVCHGVEPERHVPTRALTWRLAGWQYEAQTKKSPMILLHWVSFSLHTLWYKTSVQVEARSGATYTLLPRNNNNKKRRQHIVIVCS